MSLSNGVVGLFACEYPGGGTTYLERYEYTPYGQRQVYIKTADEPPEPKDTRCRTAMFHSSHGCDVAHQGLLFDKETELYYVRTRYLTPWLARMNQPDPLGYVDSMSMYEYGKSSPSMYADWTGAFMGTVHKQMVDAGWTAVAQSTRAQDKPSEKCSRLIVETLKKANTDQDSPSLRENYEHHYMMEEKEDPAVWETNYAKYLDKEDTNCRKAMQNARNKIWLERWPECRQALEAFGRRDHALQDFYGHAMYSRGRKYVWENVWPDAARGATPFNHPDFRPAKPSEHNLYIGPWNELAGMYAGEYAHRMKAATDFTVQEYLENLPHWLKVCRCACEWKVK